MVTYDQLNIIPKLLFTLFYHTAYCGIILPQLYGKISERWEVNSILPRAERSSDKPLGVVPPTCMQLNVARMAPIVVEPHENTEYLTRHDCKANFVLHLVHQPAPDSATRGRLIVSLTRSAAQPVEQFRFLWTVAGSTWSWQRHIITVDVTAGLLSVYIIHSVRPWVRPDAQVLVHGKPSCQPENRSRI